ncbi:MAG TPA: hypothetical protein VG367_03725 [Mucilaginibacter sp.]|jgi:hypothetical protein|nr:hypothetical protein [Mucilaginibacter sp.]
MKFFCLPLILIIALSISAHAQNFYPGYVVTSKGDTLKGYVRYRETVLNPKEAEFKVEPNDKPRIYPFGDVRYFSINIGYSLDFQRYGGPVSMDDVNINTISAERDTSFKMDTIFLKILRKDKHLTLYSYDDKLKTRFFLADGQSAPVELVYRIYMKSDVNNGSNTVNENTYKKQLLMLAEKYGKMNDMLQTDINAAGYSEMYLIPIVDKINGFTGPDPAKGNNVASPPKTKLAIMLAAFAVVAYLMFSVMHK